MENLEYFSKFENQHINTISLKCWKIIEDTLLPLSPESYGKFYNNECYILEWSFKFDSNTDYTLYFHWIGENAKTKYSPIPESTIIQNPYVHRVRQWSEPRIFFYAFNHFVVLLGNGATDNDNRLFIMRRSKTCLYVYELECKWSNLRSRTTYLLINAKEKTVFCWFGKQSSISSPINDLKELSDDLWKKLYEPSTCQIINVVENEESSAFRDNLLGNRSDYYSFQNGVSVPITLNILLEMNGNFVCCPIKTIDDDFGDNFPVLQSHLYTSSENAVFLLINSPSIWIWSWNTIKNNDLLEYVKSEVKKSGSNHDNINYIIAKEEPVQFRNLFPYWQ